MAGFECSSLPGLLPTPTVSDTNGAGSHGDGGMDLRTTVTTLPTPTARDHKGHNQRRDETCLTGALLPNSADSAATLTISTTRADSARADAAAPALLPTPRATDGTKGGPNQRGSSGDLMLPSAVVQLLPTPRASRGASGTETMYSLGAERSDTFRPQGEVLLPTPTAMDAKASGGSTASNVTLTDATVRTAMGTRDNPRLLPTPTATPYGSNQSESSGAAIRPSLQTLFSGASSSQPFDDGNN